MPLSAEQIQLNRKSAANVIRAQQGLQDFAPADWTYEQRTNYNKSLANYIAANPSLFAEGDLITAKDVQNTDYGFISDYTAGDVFSDFTSEIANQAVSINSAVNPFSEENRSKLFVALAAGLIIYFVAPVIIEAFRKPAATA